MSEPDGAGVRRRSRARAVAVATALTLLAPTAACSSGGDGGPPTINLYYPPEQNLQKVVDDCNAQAQGRYRIAYQVLPRQADEQRVQMVRRLAAQDSGMDVLGLDVTWTQEFASADWIREWTGEDRAEVERGTLEGPLATARYEDKLFAAPKNTNVQLLWYRADLVPQPPRTWDEMIEQARALKDQGKPYQVLTMGAQYEGLVVLYNTMVASAGGEIVSSDGEKAVLDAGAVRALEQLKRLATSGVVSASFSNATEDPVRLEFQSGNGAFQVNLGIRPEHFEDAELVDDDTRQRGMEFEAPVDIVESMGSDKYVYFTVEGERASAAELEELAADSGADFAGAGSSLVTRLSAESTVTEGENRRVWFNLEKIHLFDPTNGRNLTLHEGRSGGALGG
ncbi:extracellular solute-binding protein [Micromonospora inyonensis]|uniref:Extracellular solute-binding protein n=1 Tax=Micromonospora inyonensis TaxID=47866 RepID=A0A1C6S5A6_9ACTN|nr:extracellular solute-binding protein [Micromonospora inyonensis]SCL24633.1 extracellular solute-binding protein [Micromonospora inyonensis]